MYGLDRKIERDKGTKIGEKIYFLFISAFNLLLSERLLFLFTQMTRNLLRNQFLPIPTLKFEQKQLTKLLLIQFDSIKMPPLLLLPVVHV